MTWHVVATSSAKARKKRCNAVRIVIYIAFMSRSGWPFSQQMSSDQNPAYLLYIGEYATQQYREYNNQAIIMIPINPPRISWVMSATGVFYMVLKWGWNLRFLVGQSLLFFGWKILPDRGESVLTCRHLRLGNAENLIRHLHEKNLLDNEEEM